MLSPMILADDSEFYPAKREGLNWLGLKKVKPFAASTEWEYEMHSVAVHIDWTGCPEWANFMVKTKLATVWQWVYSANKPTRTDYDGYSLNGLNISCVGGWAIEGPFGFLPFKYYPKWGLFHARTDPKWEGVEDGNTD